MSATPPIVALLTALPGESEAVRSHLKHIKGRTAPDRRTRAEIGRLPGTPWHVALVEMGEGTRTAALMTSSVISWLNPEAVLCVGVAGGLKDDVHVGDVVVATMVHAIHGGRESHDGYRLRPESWHASQVLLTSARYALRDRRHIHFKPIVTSEVLLANSDAALHEHIRMHFDGAVAIEMEGAGVAHAAHLAGMPGALIVRGISDKANKEKEQEDKKGSQGTAAAAAAEAAIAVLRELEPEVAPPNTVNPGTDAISLPESRKTHTPRKNQDSPASSPSASFPAPASNLLHPQLEAPTPEHNTHHDPDPVPRTTTGLPSRPLGFTGRSSELSRLLDHLAPTPNGTPEPPYLISSITGIGGVGKTALVIEAAHLAQLRDWFPGGMLFLDLRGHEDTPVTASQAVTALLDALGVRGTDLPESTARQIDMYRALLAEQSDRLLLILDNASDPSQFQPLLPQTGHHRVLITSQTLRGSLPTHSINLDTLSTSASTALITHALKDADGSDNRAAREPDALAELADLCGRLPLALQIAAAMLRRHPHYGIASLVAELKKVGHSATALDNNGRGTDRYGWSLSLRTVLEASYRRLSPDEARLLRLFCLTPGADTGTEAVAAMADLDADAARAILENLRATHFVALAQQNGDPGSDSRWRLHDSVRTFGLSLMASDAVLTEEGEAARERVLEFYWRLADAADDRLRWLPGRREPQQFTDRVQALEWLDRERAGLVTAVQWAREKRYAETAVRLAECLSLYLSRRRYFDDWITVGQAARDASRLTENVMGEAIALINLGSALQQTDQAEEAVNAHGQALDLFQTIGDRYGEAMAWTNLGIALREADRVGEAIDAHTHALDLFQTIGDSQGKGTAWDNLGIALRQAGRVEEAIDAHTTARDLFQAAADRHGEGTAWDNLGTALRQAGRSEQAIEAYNKALEAFRAFEDWYRLGQTLSNLARSSWLLAAEAFTRAGAPTEAARAQAAADALT